MWTPEQSYEHSLRTLTLLDGFDEFKASIKHLADFGCGQGNDLEFFANMRELTEEGLPGRYLDFNCVGFDKNAEALTPQRHNITYKNLDLNKKGPIWSVPFDVIWCHDVMQYVHSPVNFLGLCNDSLNTGGMIYLHVPTTVNVMHHIFQHYTPSQHLNTFTVTQLIYLLAINGFDVKDFYMNKHKYDDNIEVVCYKERDPLPYDTSWYEMVEQGIVNANMEEIIMRNGVLEDQGLVTTWLDGTVQDYRWHT